MKSIRQKKMGIQHSDVPRCKPLFLRLQSLTFQLKAHLSSPCFDCWFKGLTTWVYICQAKSLITWGEENNWTLDSPSLSPGPAVYVRLKMCFSRESALLTALRAASGLFVFFFFILIQYVWVRAAACARLLTACLRFLFHFCPVAAL